MASITDQEFYQLAQYIKQYYGINLKKEKQTLMVGRLASLLEQKEMTSFSEYYRYLVADHTGVAAAEFINRISTNHTFFMREAEHFNYFRDKVLPVMEHGVKDRVLRIWSAGCSSGEEPYTLAMIMLDYFAVKNGGWDKRILATDISSKVLELANSGVYSDKKIASLPKPWIQKYFKKLDDEQYRVINQLRQEVIFRRFNLMDEIFPYKKKFHVIFCRNVMIYFDAVTRKRLIDKFYEHTEDGGYLFIGHTETISPEESKYRYIMPATYQK